MTQNRTDTPIVESCAYALGNLSFEREVGAEELLAVLAAFLIANSVPVFSATLCALANLCFQNYGNKNAQACFTGPRTLSCQLHRRWFTLSVALAGSGWLAGCSSCSTTFRMWTCY